MLIIRAKEDNGRTNLIYKYHGHFLTLNFKSVENFVIRMSGETWLLLGVVILLAWAYSRWKHSFWSSRGVATPPIIPFLGHLHKTAMLRKRYAFDMDVIHKSTTLVVL